MGKIVQENLSTEALKVEVKKKSTGPKKPKGPKDLRSVFRLRLTQLDLDKLKKPWMSSKSFKALTTEAALEAYVNNVLTDESRWERPYKDGPREPVVAVDCETHGLDTRVMVDWDLVWDHKLDREVCIPIYEVNIEIAGICLSADGIQGVYIPIFHEDGQNVPFEAAARLLQRLFDNSHLVFYHAGFDRDVLRHTMGITFHDFPHFEDVQVLQFLCDPKADFDDDTFSGGGEGLKGLSRDLIHITQIELGEIGKVKADVELSQEEKEVIRLRPVWTRLTKKDDIVCTTCGEKALYLREQIIRGEDGNESMERRGECAKPTCCTKITYKKKGQHVQYVPFTWIPTHIAVWYAAADAICTWMLWRYLRNQIVQDANTLGLCLKMVHEIDGELIDTITWMEHQRFTIDTERHARIVKWATRASAERRKNLQALAIKHGWEVSRDDSEEIIEDTIFNVDSPNDLPKLLFDIKGFEPTKFTEKGKRSCDADALTDLLKQHPHDEFLLALQDYKEYVALHPEKLSWDRRDKSARIYLKGSTVAGGRLAAAGGKFDRDGGVSMNIQAIKSVGGNWWVKGDVLKPDFIEADDVEAHEECDLHPSCFHEVKKDEVRSDTGQVLDPSHVDYTVMAAKAGFTFRDGKWMRKAPGIIKNHIGNYIGFSICLIPGCKTCAEKHGILIEKTKLDANQIINLRCLFVAPSGYTMVCSDYSNIEMRVAANISGEPVFIREFLEGSGDFHTLTASAIFEEFNDPKTSKARKKELRSIAKIINFALLYGGSAFAIHENLKKDDPKITMKDTQKMVETYWAKVPMFRAWCDGMQKRAREEMICVTPMGRVIKFKSAMAAQGITEPTPEQMELYFRYLRIRKAHRELEAKLKQNPSPEGAVELAILKEHMDNLWSDRDTGVRNAIDYNRFMGKIQRVAVNAPLQGLAGDFMRISLNRIRRWATKLEPLIQSVLLLHCSVHDEIDYSVKHPYAPFVVPRVTRLMKLRALFAERGWIVPIEADTEFGRSWDVQFHLTGDDGHKPSGWTDVEGMAEYLPADFDIPTVENLLRAILTGKDSAREKARAWLEANLHPRAYKAAWHALWFKDEAKVDQKETNAATIRKQLFAALQLHEYWTIDETPDGEEASLETFEQFEARCGLTAADRGFMPPGGWLFSVPQNRIRRKPLPILGDEPVADSFGSPEDLPVIEVQPMVQGQQVLPFVPMAVAPTTAPVTPVITQPNYVAPVEKQDEDDAEVEAEVEVEEEVMPYESVEDFDDEESFLNECEEALEDGPVLEPEPEPVQATTATVAEELFYDAPTKKIEPVPASQNYGVVLNGPTPEVVHVIASFEGAVLRDDLTRSEWRELLPALGARQGSKTLRCLFQGEIKEIKGVLTTEVPAKYLAEVIHA